MDARSAAQKLNQGGVILDGSTLYRYVGPRGQPSTSPTGRKITADTTDFKQIGGEEGQTYEYLGPPAAAGGSPTGSSAAPVDLFNTDYTNLAYWKLVPLTNADSRRRENERHHGFDRRSGQRQLGLLQQVQLEGLHPVAVQRRGGRRILVLNDVQSATHAYITAANISANTVKVAAIDGATISATNDSTVVAGTSGLGGDIPRRMTTRAEPTLRSTASSRPISSRIPPSRM